MKLQIEFGTALCYCPVFEINGIDATEYDFGEKYDRSPGTAEPYSCGDMQFTRRIEPSPSVLEKYSITEDEYREICDKLEVGLSFGRCGWCS